MELPVSLLADIADRGDVYYFTARCNIGVKGHMHVCVMSGDKVLMFATCTSQTNTVYKYVNFLGVDPNTFPCFKADSVNQFDMELTYVNCNKVYIIDRQEFGTMIKNGIVKSTNGSISGESFDPIVKGILISKDIPHDIKDIFRQLERP